MAVAKLWFSSDHHLFHDSMWNLFTIKCPECKGVAMDPFFPGEACKSCKGKGEVKARPFKSQEEMHERLIESHNRRVKPTDHWYCLGDISILRGSGSKYVLEPEVRKFNGHRRLILGNHDQLDVKDYRLVFEKVKGSHRIDNLLFSHFPLHPSTIGRGCVNVHGHIHTNPSPEGPYINISVEAINYTPVSLEWLKEKANEILRTEKETT